MPKSWYLFFQLSDYFFNSKQEKCLNFLFFKNFKEFQVISVTNEEILMTIVYEQENDIKTDLFTTRCLLRANLKILEKLNSISE